MAGALLAAVLLCNLADPRITESSGLVASSTYDDVLYTHNDSGDTARFFAIDDRSCRTRATFVLPGVQARDWEDISRGPGRTIWLGDIGDNSGTRVNGVLVHRVTEPHRLDGVAKLQPTSFRLRYPDGPHDAEALLVHPTTGDLLIVTKGFAGGVVYAASLPLRAGSPNTLHEVGRVPVPEVTGGDISPDGTHVVLRNYSAAYEWNVKGTDVAGALKGEPTRIPLPPSPQGEGITYSRDGRTLIVSSEGAGSPLQAVDRATAATARPAPVARRTGWPLAATAAVLGAVVLLGAGAIGLWRTRLRHAR